MASSLPKGEIGGRYGFSLYLASVILDLVSNLPKGEIWGRKGLSLYLAWVGFGSSLASDPGSLQKRPANYCNQELNYFIVIHKHIVEKKIFQCHIL